MQNTEHRAQNTQHSALSTQYSIFWDAYPTPATLPPPIVADSALPLVSIVTPSFNQGRFIGDTITSVLSQDYPNIEYWVIDGGSSDATLDVLRSIDDPRLHWLSERDGGQSDAINKGWSRCQGAIVAWLNSDDTYEPGAIRAQVAALQAHPNCGAVYGDARYIDADGQAIARLYSPAYNVLRLVRLELPVQPTVFLRRALVDAVGPINRQRRYSMDTDYWLRAAKLTDFCRTPALIATYRLHDESKTVGQFDGFYRDWLAIATAFFADPATPCEQRNQRGAVLADIYSAMANNEAQNGDVWRSVALLHHALRNGGLRPRMAKWPVVLAERYLPFSLSRQFTQWWTYLRRWRETVL